MQHVDSSRGSSGAVAGRVKGSVPTGAEPSVRALAARNFRTTLSPIGQQPIEYAYASKRWAAAVFGALHATSDLRTVTAWGRHIGAATGTLRGWCRAAQVRSKPSLDFARMLRATVLAQSRGWEIHHLLDIVDQRTLVKLLAKAGCPRGAVDYWRPTVEGFVDGQHLVEQTRNLDAIVELLARRGLVARDWADTRRFAGRNPTCCREDSITATQR